MSHEASDQADGIPSESLDPWTTPGSSSNTRKALETTPLIVTNGSVWKARKLSTAKHLNTPSKVNFGVQSERYCPMQRIEAGFNNL